MNNMHPTAVIHPTAKIDPTATIGPYAVIGEDVIIGSGTTVGANAVVEFAVIGKNNILFPGCFVGTAPQDLKYASERTRLVMGDNNKVRECVTFISMPWCRMACSRQAAAGSHFSPHRKRPPKRSRA